MNRCSTKARRRAQPETAKAQSSLFLSPNLKGKPTTRTKAEKPAIEIITGGQTGVDRAALEWAVAHRLPHGGWCPRGRKAEDGLIPHRFRLQETRSNTYAVRTRWNVRDSDGTVIFSTGRAITDGTRQTLDWARRLRRPVLRLTARLAPHEAARRLDQFIRQHNVQRLNLAGPRISQEPGIGLFVRAVLNHSHVLVSRSR